MPGYPLPMMYYPPSATPIPLAGMLAWYDFSDLSTLFQNTDFTNQVTASGQNIGSVIDKSGNGNHLVYGEGASITYLDTGGHGSVYTGSGTSGYLVCTSFAGATGIQKLALHCSWTMAVLINSVPFIIGDGPSFTAVGLETQELSGTQRVYVDPSAVHTFTGTPGMLGGSAKVVSAWFDGSQADPNRAALRVNGVQGAASGATASTATPTCTRLQIPSLNAGGLGAGSGRCYGAILYNTIYTGADLDTIEDYLASLAGIVI